MHAESLHNNIVTSQCINILVKKSVLGTKLFLQFIPTIQPVYTSAWFIKNPIVVEGKYYHTADYKYAEDKHFLNVWLFTWLWAIYFHFKEDATEPLWAGYKTTCHMQ